MILIAHAATTGVYNAQRYVQKFNEVLFFPLITLMLVIALVVFLYGCFEFVVGASDSTKRQTGRRHILWGFIGMLIMLTAYALLTIAAGTFGIEVDDPIRPGDTLDAPVVVEEPVATLPDGTVPEEPAAVCVQYEGVFCVIPSAQPNVLTAFKEEIQYTGGIALGTTNISSVEGVLKFGETDELSVLRALYALDEYRSADLLTVETQQRLLDAMKAVAPESYDRAEFTFSIEKVLGEPGG